MNKQNEFIEIAGSYGEYWKNGLSLTFKLESNPVVSKIYKLIIETQDYPTKGLEQSMIKEIENTQEFFNQASNKYHLCATLEAVNNIISSYTENKDALFIENEDDEIIGNWW